MSHRIAKNSLQVLNDGVWKDLYVFETEPWRVEHYPIGYVVTLETPVDRRVFLISEEGKLVWELPKAVTSDYTQAKGHHPRTDPFTYTRWEEDTLFILTQDGFEYKVDSRTGALTQTRWLK